VVFLEPGKLAREDPEGFDFVAVFVVTGSVVTVFVVAETPNKTEADLDLDSDSDLDLDLYSDPDSASPLEPLEPLEPVESERWL
jgi:hypothetical protein